MTATTTSLTAQAIIDLIYQPEAFSLQDMEKAAFAIFFVVVMLFLSFYSLGMSSRIKKSSLDSSVFALILMTDIPIMGGGAIVLCGLMCAIMSQPNPAAAQNQEHCTKIIQALSSPYTGKVGLDDLKTAGDRCGQEEVLAAIGRHESAKK